MSTQSYYKDRLGFDPREALYDGPVKGSSRGHSHSRENSHYSTNNGNDHYATPPKKHKHHAAYQQQHESTPQGGYEDALSQFKGSMSIWEYFVENTDKMGMSVGVCVELFSCRLHGELHLIISCCVDIIALFYLFCNFFSSSAWTTKEDFFISFFFVNLKRCFILILLLFCV